MKKLLNFSILALIFFGVMAFKSFPAAASPSVDGTGWLSSSGNYKIGTAASYNAEAFIDSSITHVDELGGSFGYNLANPSQSKIWLIGLMTDYHSSLAITTLGNNNGSSAILSAYVFYCTYATLNEVCLGSWEPGYAKMSLESISATKVSPAKKIVRLQVFAVDPKTYQPTTVLEEDTGMMIQTYGSMLITYK